MKGDFNLKVEVETLDSTQVRLQIELPIEDVNKALKEAYQTLRSYVSLPGFRKGRAPLSLIKSRYPEHINSEVVKQLVIPAYERAILGKQLLPLEHPVFEPELTKFKVVENQPLVFAAVVNVKPTFTLPDYEDIQTDKAPVNVPREAVETYISELQSESATFEPIEEERPVEDSDCIRLDWNCFIDGVELEDEAGQDVDIDLSTGTIQPELQAGLLGMRAGERKSISVTFDATHRVPMLAGKCVTYDVMLHAITRKQLPALDDEFAKDLGYDTYQHLFGVIWNNLVEDERMVQVSKQKSEILAQLIDSTDITIPEYLIEKSVQQAIENVLTQLEAQGQTAEEAGINLETLPSELRRDVIQRTKQTWIFDEIAAFENIYVSDDELELEIRRVAEQTNRDPQKYAELLRSSNRLEEFRVELQHEKIYQFLIQRASAKQPLIIT